MVQSLTVLGGWQLGNIFLDPDNRAGFQVTNCKTSVLLEVKRANVNLKNTVEISQFTPTEMYDKAAVADQFLNS